MKTDKEKFIELFNSVGMGFATFENSIEIDADEDSKVIKDYDVCGLVDFAFDDDGKFMEMNC